jgi:Family of unknown function (DUF6157)
MEARMHSTNYTNAFIEVADDCRTEVGKIPPAKDEKTIAQMHYDLIHDHPYRYTSDEVVFAVYAAKNRIGTAQLEGKKAEFFAKGQPCLRSSPLGKSYGWGIHYDSESRMAIYGKESEEYARLKNDSTLKHLKAMKSAR